MKIAAPFAMRRKLVSLVLVAFFAAGGGTSCSSGTETAGACSCSAKPGSELRTSLDCLCAEFPAACATYDKVRASADCSDDSRWWLMEQTGCGRIIVSTGWGEGGNTWVYDGVTHQLIGAQISSDIGFGSCNVSSYAAGNIDPCDEGTVCSLCDASGASCAPACSIQLLKNNGLGAPQYTLGPDEFYDCPAPEQGARRPEVHRGCGKVTVIEGSMTTVFAADSHEPLAVSYDGMDECSGKWGDPGAPCADETICSLCAGAPDVCQF